MHARHFVTESGVTKHVEAKEDRDDAEGSNVEDDGSQQAEDDEHGGGTGVSPREESLQALALGGNVTEDCLDTARHSSEAIVTSFHDLLRFGSRDGVEFFVQFVRLGGICVREAGIHVGRVSGPKTEVPDSNQEHVEEECRKYELRIPDEDEEEEVHENGSNRIFPRADIGEPLPYGNHTGENAQDTKPIGFATAHTPHITIDIQHELDDFLSKRGLGTRQTQGNDFHGCASEVFELDHAQGMQVVHFGQQRASVAVKRIHPRGRRKSYGQLYLAHFLDSSRQ